MIFSIIIYQLLFSFYFSQANVLVDEGESNVGYLESTIIIPEINVEFNIYQKLDNMTFEMPSLYRRSEAELSRYYLVEIKIQQFIKSQENIQFFLLLVYSQAVPASRQYVNIQENEQEIVGDAIDYNGFYLQKTYLYLLIDTKDVNFQGIYKQYISCIIPQYADISYSLKITPSQEKPCPNNCSGLNQGLCQTDGTCNCYIGFFDEDCSVSGFQLYMMKDIIKVQKMQASYLFFLPPIDFEDDLQININIESQGAVTVILQMERRGLTYLPNEYENDDLQTVDVTQPYQVIIKSQFFTSVETPKKRRSLLFRLAISFPNQLSDRPEIICKLELSVPVPQKTVSTSTAQVLLYVVIGLVALALFICLAVFTTRRIQQQAAQQEQQVVLELQNQLVACQVLQTLTKKDLELYMPLLKYEDIKEDLLKEETCSVCCMEYEETEVFRQTLCNHVFHQNCIEQWFAKHENCPNCRENLSKTDMERIYKQKQQREQVKLQEEPKEKVEKIEDINRQQIQIRQNVQLDRISEEAEYFLNLEEEHRQYPQKQSLQISDLQKETSLQFVPIQLNLTTPSQLRQVSNEDQQLGNLQEQQPQ